MKKTFIYLLIATSMISTAFARDKKALPPELNMEVKQVISLTDLTPEMAKEVLEGMHPDIAIECPEGKELPFKYMGDFGLFSINFAPNLSIKIEKTCYFRILKKNRKDGTTGNPKGYMSFDLKQWDKAKNLPPKKKSQASFGISPDKTHVLLKTYPVSAEESAETN